ncbi:MAG: hypothetical protein KM310_06245 [Clostridiales bacterium]|nr:hypothetical protein [Clostridiales bacterium]
MNLTERRKEFLRHVVELYRKTRLPVHYPSLAKTLGVSKWTAYDVLRELERLGYLMRHYTLTPGGVGRSHVVFSPSRKALQIFDPKEASEEGEGYQEWRAVKEKVLSTLRQAASEERLQEVLDTVLGEFYQAKSPVARAAWSIALFLAYVRQLGHKGRTAIQRLMAHAPGGKTRLVLLAGAVLGMWAQEKDGFWEEKLADLLREHVPFLLRLTDEEASLLDPLWQESGL